MTVNLQSSLVALCAVLFTGAAALPGEPGVDQTEPAVETQCRFLKLEHVDCEVAEAKLRFLFGLKGAPRKVTSFEPINALLLRGTPAEVQQMEYLVSQIDVSESKPPAQEDDSRQMKLFPVRHAGVGSVSEVLGSLLPTSGRRGSKERVRIATDERTNLLVVVGTEEQLAVAAELVAALDVPLEHPAPGAD